MKKGKKTNISYSDYSKYLQCGHKFLIENLLKLSKPVKSIHMYFGNAIHDSIRKGIESNINLEDRISNFKYRFKKDMMDNMSDSFDMYSLDEFTEQGVNILTLLSIDKILYKYEIIGIEKFINDKLYKDFHFNGCIDLFLKNKETGRYVIIDWKTSGTAWNEEEKKRDKIFLSQMIFYKYFYSKKYEIPIDQIDCKYVVLNRLKDKEDTKAGFGGIQTVEIKSNLNDIEDALEDLGKVIRNIYIRKSFKKAKLENKKGMCFFCPYKDGHKLCNNNSKQYIDLIRENS